MDNATKMCNVPPSCGSLALAVPSWWVVFSIPALSLPGLLSFGSSLVAAPWPWQSPFGGSLPRGSSWLLVGESTSLAAMRASWRRFGLLGILPVGSSPCGRFPWRCPCRRSQWCSWRRTSSCPDGLLDSSWPYLDSPSWEASIVTITIDGWNVY